jgi:hypothetical protein
MAHAAAELKTIRPATVAAVMRNEMVNARGKFVRDHAVEKFSKCMGHGQLKPLPEAACSADLSAMAIVKYSGTITVSAHSSSNTVASQFGRPPPSSEFSRRRRRAGVVTAAGPGGVRLVAIRATLLGGG